MTKKKSSASSYNYNTRLGDFLHWPWDHRCDGGQELGVEIEVEGRDLPTGNIKGWQVVPDGSLRGESAEYIFRGPATRDELDVRLDAFNKAMANATVNQSYRTSVHVHLNFQDQAIKNVYNHIILYTIFEDVFANFCGKERVGNLFTLRAKDAEYYLERIAQSIREDYINILNDPNIRYSAANPVALFSHGTLEHRSMRGTTDIQVITQWVNMLLAVKDAACSKFTDPVQIVTAAQTDPEAFINIIFNREQIQILFQGQDDLRKIVEGAKLVQHLAYQSDWAPTPEKPEKAKTPPTYAKYSRGTTRRVTNTMTTAFLDIETAATTANRWTFAAPAAPEPAPAWIHDQEEN